MLNFVFKSIGFRVSFLLNGTRNWIKKSTEWNDIKRNPHAIKHEYPHCGTQTVILENKSTFCEKILACVHIYRFCMTYNFFCGF